MRTQFDIWCDAHPAIMATVLLAGITLLFIWMTLYLVPREDD